ncbi:MAG: GrdX protein [Clostridiales bacterium]|nr:GrdX protein [Clostridiales bacterium]
MKVLTNNPKVLEQFHSYPAVTVDYRAVSLHELMVLVRDFVHARHRLLTHPLSGSVKPNETLYKSIGLTEQPEDQLCLESLNLIEQSISTVDRFARIRKDIKEEHHQDLQLVDLTLISSAIDSLAAAKPLPGTPPSGSSRLSST